MSSALAPVRAESLATQVSHTMKDAIFAGRFKPGEALRELHLARSMSVSQATVREALAQLERLWLVVRERNRRTTVTSFTKEEVRERLEVRLALEEMAAVKAAANLTREDLAALEGLADRIDQSGEGGDHFVFVQADMRFHRFLWQRTGSAVLAATLDQLTTPLFAFLSVMHSAELRDLRTSKPHQRLVEALRSRREQRIRKEIRAHIEGSYGEFLASGQETLDKFAAGAKRRISGSRGSRKRR
jgi:DNA-binding GntR family transcriptional regulator